MSRAPLVEPTDSGLYCAAGDFYIDPWRRVARAVITHAHSDHARRGCARYLASAHCAPLLKTRFGGEPCIDAIPYGEAVIINGVRVSLHPAGHVLGSAQVRIEHRGEVWVISGDYKLQPDPTCAPFEPLRCDVFVTESTYGLPVYRFPDPATVFDELNAWWRENQRNRRASVVYAYSLGKAQRVLAGVDARIGPIFIHSAVRELLPAYEAAGVALPTTHEPDAALIKANRGQMLVVAPPAAADTRWMKRFGELSQANASGWMRIRGVRRRSGVERGFVLSDHADWPGLLTAIDATAATRIGVTHGYTAPLVRWLREHGREAWEIPTRFLGERPAEAEGDAEPAAEA